MKRNTTGLFTWWTLSVLLLTLGVMPVFAQQTIPGTSVSIEAGRFDNGKMWTFEDPPIDYFEEAYAFSPEADWFEDARLSALRIPGCSASFASPHGLVLTNHHCARSAISQVSMEGEQLLDNGFVATSLDEERRIENYYADQLIAIEDVTFEIQEAQEAAQTTAERAAARDETIAAITERIRDAAGGAEAGVHVEVVALYNGGKYSAYTFRRHTDVRLVMAPELQLGYYGGDSDNFTYPRFNLDMTLYRVYNDEGEPLATPNYFQWTTQGSREGEAVFVVGNPGSTSRLETVAQLEFRRDVMDSAVLGFINNRIDALESYYDADPETAEALGLRNVIFSLKNGQKLYNGRMGGLTNTAIMERRLNDETRFRESIRVDGRLLERYGELHEQMTAIQSEKREWAAMYAATVALTNPPYSSAILRRAIQAQAYQAQIDQGANPDSLASVRQQIAAIPDQPEGLQRSLLEARLQAFVDAFGDEDPMVQAMLDGHTPSDAAADLLASSALASQEGTQWLLGLTEEAPADATPTPQPVASIPDDPAVELAAALMPNLQAYQSAWAGLLAREQEVAAALGRARYAVYGTEIPPDATFSLRLADGVVSPYSYNGTVAPAYTNYYGLYDRYYSFKLSSDTMEGSEWDLPSRWLDPPASLDLSTPLNLVTTADIIGGNSGSPLINRDLELVGLMFDGNIESLPGDYIYLPESGNRSVAVDVRGMLAALNHIYDADRLVLELTVGTMVPTEAEADARMQP